MRSDKKVLETIGDKFIINTKDTFLTDAINWFKQNDIPLYGIQTNPTQTQWTTSPKAYAELYIDDAALGIPLVKIKGSRPCVNWVKIKKLLIKEGIL